MTRVHWKAGFAIVLAAAAASPSPAGAAITHRPRIHAITGARIVVAPGRVVDNGTIILRDGLIEAVGTKIDPPADAWLVDGSGRTVTAGFIDACTEIGQKKGDGGGAPATGEGGGPPRPPRDAPPGTLHPITRIRPERRVLDTLTIDATAFEKHRAMGFATAVTMPGEGIFRGEAALINLGTGPVSANVIRPLAGQVIAFEHGGFGQGYPSSLMGSIAAIRQTLLDAQRQAVWVSRYDSNGSGMARPEYLSAYTALGPLMERRTPAIFDVRDSADVTRALSLAQEFSLAPMVIASGAEAAETGTIEALGKSGYPVILPLAFPDKPKVEDPDEALNVTLQDLERWDLAPENPSRLANAGVPFALGTCRLTTTADFIPNLRKAIGRGLTADRALEALTVSPARFFGLEKSLGTIEAGKIANLTVFEGAGGDDGIFAEKARPVMVFVDGTRHDVEQKKSKGDPTAKVDPRGTWSVVYDMGGRTFSRTWTIEGKEGSWSGTAETQAGVVGFSSVKLAGNEMTVVLPAQGPRPSQEIVVVITGDRFEGSGELGGGTSYTVKGTRTASPEGGVL